jgi:hypothetical protein
MSGRAATTERNHLVIVVGNDRPLRLHGCCPASIVCATIP